MSDDQFDPGSGYDDDGPANLYEERGITDYDAALEYAGAFYLTLAEGAQADVRIIAVSELGAVQVIGTGAVFHANDGTVLQGPCILVYASDAKRMAADLVAQQS